MHEDQDGKMINCATFLLYTVFSNRCTLVLMHAHATIHFRPAAPPEHEDAGSYIGYPLLFAFACADSSVE